MEPHLSMVRYIVNTNPCRIINFMITKLPYKEKNSCVCLLLRCVTKFVLLFIDAEFMTTSNGIFRKKTSFVRLYVILWGL